MPRHRGFRDGEKVNSQPFFPTEQQQNCPAEGNHQKNSKWIAEPPMQLRHNVEVHSIQTGYQGRRQKDDRNHRKDFDDFVLLQIYKTEERILQVIKPVKTETGVFEQ